MRTSRSVFFSFVTVIALAGCQLIGGLDELRLAAGSGGGGGLGGCGGGGLGGSSSASSGSNGAGGAGGGPPTTALWSKRFGDGTGQYVTDVAVDASANIFVVGAFLGTLDFGTGTALVTAGDYDAFLAKLDSDGNPLWSIRFGGTGPDRIESIGLTATGDPIVGGSHGGAFSIGATNVSHNGGLDGFVMRFSGTDGSLMWSRRFGDAQNQRCGSVAVNPSTDDVLCFGDFSGASNFGSMTLTSSGLEDLFVANYSSTGTFSAAIRTGDALGQTARSIVVNSLGIAYVAAQFDGQLDWGNVTSSGQGDVFLGKFYNNSGVAWALQMGDTNTQQPNNVALAGDGGGIAVVGEFEGAATLGGKAISSKGGYDAFIARVDAMGAVSWIRTVGDAPMVAVDDQYATDVAVSAGGTVFVTGHVSGTVNFGNNVVSGPGDTDFFVMRIDSTGQTDWAFRSGSDNSQFGRAIALSGANHLVVAGDFRNTLDLGNGPLTSAGSNDIFIAKLNR